MKNHHTTYLAILIVIATLCNCSYLGMTTHRAILRVSNSLNPSLSAAKVLNPERTFTVYGQLKLRERSTVPMVITALSNKYGKQEIVSRYYIAGEGYFSLYLPEGSYSIVILADLDKDSLFDAQECIGYYNERPYFTVDPGNAQSGIICGLQLFANPQRPFSLNSTIQLHYPLSFNAEPTYISPPGSIRQLNDTLFSPSMSELGIYKPDKFLALSGIYFYALKEAEPDKIPLIMVHGYGGSPRDFDYIVKSIDTSTFSLWFFYYPSGRSLEKTAAIFYEIFLSNKIIRYKPQGISILAHSMGGLIVRRALNILSQSDVRIPSTTYISLCTPYGGNEEADDGLKNAPVKIESWKELASKSDFIDKLNKDKLDKNIRFHLIFGYKMESNASESSDGTIVLKSQLHYPAQKIASTFTGFNETHKSILSSTDVFEKINSILNNKHP
jgi:uncharacterized alpha/beta hydrolase family protein